MTLKTLKAAEPQRTVHEDYTEIRPPDTLRARALVRSHKGPNETLEMINRAEKALEALAPNFKEWMLSEVKRLTDHFEHFDASAKDADDCKSFFLVAHDLRGQAMQFGYPIAGQIAAGLCDLLQNRSSLPVPPIILRRYVQAIASIVRSGVKDEVNATALELGRELGRIVAEYRKDEAASDAARAQRLAGE